MHLVYAISGGYVEIQGNKVTVLADVVERTDDLDEAKLLEENVLQKSDLNVLMLVWTLMMLKLMLHLN